MWATTTTPPSFIGATNGWANSFRSWSQKRAAADDARILRLRCFTGCARWGSTTSSSTPEDHLRSAPIARVSNGSAHLGTRRRAIDAGAGLSIARPRLAAALRGDLRHRGAQRVRGFSPSGNGPAQSPRRRLRVRQDAPRMRLSWVLVQEHTVERLEDGEPVTAAPHSAPPGRPQFPRRGSRASSP